MGNEKYLNYYIETLTTTMTDCVIRNVSMQANAKITDEVVKEQTEQIEVLIKLNNELQETVQHLKQTNTTNENNVLKELKDKLVESESLVAKHKQEYDELINKFRDYDSVKNQATHVETFKGELIRAREETNRVRIELETEKGNLNNKIAELNEKIEYLQLTPAKRKKIDEQLNKEVASTNITNVVDADGVLKDGGTF